MVETERNIVQQALERESAFIRRQLKDACIDIKCEMMSAVKAEVKKRLQKSYDKTLAMIVFVKQEIKDLKLELSVAATGVSYVNAFSARLIGVLPQFMIQWVSALVRRGITIITIAFSQVELVQENLHLMLNRKKVQKVCQERCQL